MPAFGTAAHFTGRGGFAQVVLPMLPIPSAHSVPLVREVKDPGCCMKTAMVSELGRGARIISRYGAFRKGFGAGVRLAA
jgi:hypothetical protein